MNKPTTVATQPQDFDENSISIGGLSEQTGIPPITIRQWERRYGSPTPLRLRSGHRRYSMDEVTKLKLVKFVLDQGFKPSQVLGYSMGHLKSLIPPKSNHPPKAQSDAEATSAHLWHAIDSHCIHKIFEHFYAYSDTHGWVNLLDLVIAPMMRSIGDKWACGTLSIGREHTISESILLFLGQQTKVLPSVDHKSQKPVILATPEGDLHNLGLKMLASLLSQQGVQTCNAGANLPITELLELQQSLHAPVICLSLTQTQKNTGLKTYLRTLSDALPNNVTVYLGGQGAQKFRTHKRFQVCHSFAAFLAALDHNFGGVGQ